MSTGAKIKSIHEFVGTKMGKITILQDVGIVKGKRMVYGRCDCGKEKIFHWQQLKNGSSKSCGCRPCPPAVGKMYEYWTILEDFGSVRGTRMVKVGCKCGTERVIEYKAIRRGTSKSCGCMVMDDVIDKLNKRYDRLSIINPVGVVDGKLIVLAKCDCGTIKEYKFVSIITGNTKSCGCLNDEQRRKADHGLSNHPLMRVWGGMIQRCYNKNCDSYVNYGAKGVTICDEWRYNFKAFYDWAISNGWRLGLEIDKDALCVEKPGKIYSPKYCQFMTQKENGRHKSTSIYIEYNGERLHLMDWSERLGIPGDTLRHRIRTKKWGIEKAFTQPVRIQKRYAS